MTEEKSKRLAFAQGYADAWAKRDRRQDGDPYEEGYVEGEDDRRRADSPGRQPARKT